MYDNDQFDLSRYKWLLPVVAVFIIVTMIFAKGSDDNLKGYTGSEITDSTVSETDSSSKDKHSGVSEETFIYRDTNYMFELEVPVSWSIVNGTGSNVSFIHNATGTQLNITVSDYDPQINNVDERQISEQALTGGFELLEFLKEDNSSYYIAYTNEQYGFIEYTYWDRSSIIKLGFTLDIRYYDDSTISNTIQYIHDSFSWQEQDPIPEELTIVYIPFGNFEIGIMTDWTVGSSGNTILSTNAESTAAVSVSVNETTASPDSISQVEYTNYLAQSHESFMLNSFSNDGSKIQCSGTYILNGVEIDLMQVIYVQNGYEYILSFDTENSETSKMAESIQHIINSFRVFG